MFGMVEAITSAAVTGRSTIIGCMGDDPSHCGSTTTHSNIAAAVVAPPPVKLQPHARGQMETNRRRKGRRKARRTK